MPTGKQPIPPCKRSVTCVLLTVSAASEIRKVELDLVPALIKSHRHRADERLHSRRGLEKENTRCENY